MKDIFFTIRPGYYFKFNGERFIKTDASHAMSVSTPGPDKEFKPWEIVEYDNSR